MTYVLGINAYHGDSSACLLSNGNLVSAVEEERFRRVKHWAGFPSKAVEYCLSENGINISDIQHIAINSDPKVNLLKKIGFTISNRPNLGLVLDRLRNLKERTSIEDEISILFPNQTFTGKVHFIEHHLSHLASAFYVSPFERSIVVSVDGFGDFSSAAWGVGEGKNIFIENKVFFPHSLGIFYQALTQFLGFSNYGDEYKVMGLAPYGQPSYLDEMRDIVLLNNDGSFALNLKYFRHHKEKVAYKWEGGSPTFGKLFSTALEDLLGVSRKEDDVLTQKHKDIARSVQMMYEEAFFHLLNKLYERYKIDSLCIAGGCGMNSVANGKVYQETPLIKTYIQSAAGDAGGAIGAAYVVDTTLEPSRKRFHMEHAYLGPEYSNYDYEKLLDRENKFLEKEHCTVRRIDDIAILTRETANAISQGLIIGWFQGRMEWGPRALGNRSILGDPRRTDMKDILNKKIKRRESFRPFAPSILRESVLDWFEVDDDVPFMMKVFQIRKDKHNIIPAVTHVDGSGRLQTVYKHTNPRYYKLIESFCDITNVPILLNTSFNENEPVVCRPEEAFDCFLRTKMDVLVLGNWLIQRA